MAHGAENEGNFTGYNKRERKFEPITVIALTRCRERLVSSAANMLIFQDCPRAHECGTFRQLCRNAMLSMID